MVRFDPMVPIKLVNQKIRDRNQGRWLRSNAFDISICYPGVLPNDPAKMNKPEKTGYIFSNEGAFSAPHAENAEHLM